MSLNARQISEFNEEGFLLIKNCFKLSELRIINEEVNYCLLDVDYPRLIEDDGVKVRTVNEIVALNFLPAEITGRLNHLGMINFLKTDK